MKVVQYLKGVALAIAGKEKKQDFTVMSVAMINALKDKGFEIKKIEVPAPDLTIQEIWALPSYELMADGVVVGNVNFLNLFRGMWNDGTFGKSTEIDNARQTLAAITILNAFKSAGYVRLQAVPPPQC